MPNGNLLIILLVVFLVSYVIYNNYNNKIDTKMIYSNKYDKYFYIKDNMSNVDESLNYLNDLSVKISKLVDYMYKENLPNKYVSSKLYFSWLNCKLGEIPSNADSIAYTLGKGVEIRLCIRKNNKEFEDPNTSMFVLLHELAHIMSESKGHTTEFKNNFSYITHLASYLGIYKPENFHTNPKTYCGFEINTTPCSYGTCAIKKII